MIWEKVHPINILMKDGIKGTILKFLYLSDKNINMIALHRLKKKLWI